MLGMLLRISIMPAMLVAVLTTGEGTKADAEIWQIVKSGEDYFSNDVEINGVDFSVYYTPVFDDKNTVVGMAFAGMSQDNIKVLMNNMVFQLVLLMAFVVVVLSIIIIFIAKVFSKSISSVADNLNELANGNLDKQVNCHSNVKEVSVLIDSTAILQQNFTDIITKIKETSNSIFDSNVAINENIVTSNDNAENISSVSQELAASMELVASNSEEMQNNAEEMFATVENLFQETEEGSSAVDKMKYRAKDMKNLCSGMAFSVCWYLTEGRHLPIHRFMKRCGEKFIQEVKIRQSNTIYTI